MKEAQTERTDPDETTLQQQSETWPYGQEQQTREHECRALKRREVRLHVSAEAERRTPWRVGHTASDRTPKRTHRVVQRINRVHERVDRILQGSLGRARVSLVRARIRVAGLKHARKGLPPAAKILASHARRSLPKRALPWQQVTQ